MPLIIIKMLKGRNTDIKRDLIKKITITVQEVLNTAPEQISVIIDEIDQTNIGTNGNMIADMMTQQNNDMKF